MPEGVQVQGLCRFSFPCTGGFKKYNGSLEERRAALYAAERLDQRMLWFEHVFLPPIRAQSDPDFTIHLLLGEDFPEPWRARLHSLIDDIPQLSPHWREPGDHRAICRDVLTGARDPTRAKVAEFRLDDDDAVAITYVQQLRRTWPRLSRLASAQGRIALDHGKGMVFEAVEGGQIRLHTLLTHCWSAGLAVYLNSDDTDTIMDFPHHKIWMRVPFVNLSDTVMFIRGDHPTNDARTPFAAAGDLPVAEDDMAELILRRFDIDIAVFRTAWAELAER